MKDDNNKQPTRPVDDDDDKKEGQEGQERPTALEDDTSSSAVPSAEAAAAAADTWEEEEGSSRGDPRMRRACLARIANPKLSLLGALKIGGFTFQQENPTCEDFDNDGVRLRQRKNQLCVSYYMYLFCAFLRSPVPLLRLVFVKLTVCHFLWPIFIDPFSSFYALGITVPVCLTSSIVVIIEY